MTAPASWRFGISSTLRGVYVLRYGLFAGGVAIAGALLERALAPSRRPWEGLAAGLALGLVLFRGQLRALRWPRVFLGQESIHVVHGRNTIALPWKALSGVSREAKRLTLSLKEPMLAPDGHPAEAIQLDAPKLGVAAEELEQTLQGYLNQPETRGQLPPDASVRALLSPPAPDGR